MKLKETTIRPFTVARLITAASLCAALNCPAADEAAPAAASEPEKPFVTGTLNLTLDTHYILYGQDVWATGTSWGDPLFHPSIELNLDLGGGFKGIAGLWFDINNNAETSIGDAVQEVDAWLGAAYGVKDFTFTLLYQEWMYSSQSERVLDFKIAHADILNPSLTVHSRLHNGLDLDNGVVGVLGIAPAKTLGIVTLSLPVNLAAATDGYYGGDGGFSFASVGLGAGVPLKFMKGNWTFNAGITYYHSDDDVIPGNPESDFVTGNLGLVLAF